MVTAGNVGAVGLTLLHIHVVNQKYFGRGTNIVSIYICRCIATVELEGAGRLSR